MANPTNNSFENWASAGNPGVTSGDCNNWDEYSVNGGTVTRESWTPKAGTYCANIRSNSSGNVNSIGGITSEAFSLTNDYLMFWIRNQSYANSETTIKIYNSSDVLLGSVVYPSVNEGGTWAQRYINVSSIKGQSIKIHFEQHTKAEGSGYYTHIDLVECDDTSAGTELVMTFPTKQETILSDAKIKVLDNQQTITSDALITSTIQKTILSDAKIKIVDLQENLLSDAKVVDQYQETILSDAEIKIRKTITSDARILISVAEKVNTDFRTRIEAESLANLFLATQFGAKISCDLRTRKDTDSKISTDLRFTLYDPSLISLHPLARTDFHVYVDDVQLGDSDLKLDSIKIVHSADNKSNAEFVLLRKHDDLNNPTTITANNVVKIYLKTKLEFTGRIVTLDTNSEEESVNVKCETDDITEDYNIVTKELPLTVLNTQIHLYDILINDVSIQNYYPSTKLVIVGEGKYWTGTAWTTRLSQALTFDDFATAQDYIEARIQTYIEQYESEHSLSFNIPAGHLYTYTDFDYYIHEDIDDTFLKKFPTVENYEQNPQYYKGIMIDLGKEIRQQIFITYVTHNTQVTAQKVEDGTFKFLPNQTYFWRASVNWFDWNGGYRPSGWQYIGTSLGSLSTDLYEITGADYRYQRILDDYVLGLGFYTLGTAPFKSVSLKNGKKITRPKWVDKEDGLYYEKDDGYDYESYNEQIAALEYDKLKNINGAISPISSANLDLTIDGYLYYALKLLTRINIANTTTVDIYKNSNGFPVSIKQISIDSSTMKVNIVCDNQKSEYELELIDGTYPDAPEEFGEFSQKYYTKFDLSNWENVDG